MIQLNKHIIFAFIFLCGATCSFSQEKFEKESVVKADEVPVKASHFIDSLKLLKSVKWFYEEGLSNSSYEAKFLHEKRKYSVEFDTLGNVEDVEVSVDWNELPNQICDAINAHLNNHCDKFKIVKIQIQYSGQAIDLIRFINGGNADGITRQYELIVRCKNEKEVSLFEFRFDREGVFLHKSQIVLNNSSHLEY